MCYFERNDLQSVAVVQIGAFLENFVILLDGDEEKLGKILYF